MTGLWSRHVGAQFLRHVAWLSAAFVALAIGADLVQQPEAWGEREAGLTAFAASLAAILPTALSCVACAAAAFTLQSLRRDGSLLVVAGAGIPLARVALWIVVAALPLAALTACVACFPPAPLHDASPGVDAVTDVPVRLQGGGLLWGASPADRGAPAAILLPAARRLILGRHMQSGPAAPGATIPVQVDEFVELGEASLHRVRPAHDTVHLVRVSVVPASLLAERERAALDVNTLRRWVEHEPRRHDLRWVLAGMLVAGPRLLALLLLVSALLLRPTVGRAAGRLLLCASAVAGVLGLEVWLAALCATGALAPDVAAWLPTGLALLAGTWCALRSDRVAAEQVTPCPS